jgi:predicted amidohydrolase YtcJ
MSRLIRIPLTLALILSCSSLLAAPDAPGVPAMPWVDADAIFFNGKVITMDRAEKSKIVQAFAVKDGRFLAVGSVGEAMRHKGRTTRVVDLGGRTVIPGLSDGHFHGVGGGRGMDFRGVRSIAELLDIVKKTAAAAPAGQLLRSNSDWHEGQLAETRLPLASELDIAAPNHPVVLIRGGHSYILNGAALALFGITTATVPPSGGAIPKTPEGALTGELIDAARSLARLPPLPPLTAAEQRQGLLDTQAFLNAQGITSIRFAGGSVGSVNTWKALRDEGILTVRPSFLISAGSATAVNNVIASGAKQDEPDDWVKIVGFKMSVDGGFEGGLMREPYAEPYGLGGTYRGLQTANTSTYYGALRAAATAGWRVATHAVGDAGIDLVLDGYSQANLTADIRQSQWVIEHAFIAHPEHFPKLHELGIALSVQNHLYLAGPSLRRMWGDQRSARVTPVKTYLEQGLLLAGGTDAAVIPANLWWAMYHFITRDTISDGVYGPDERVLNRENVLRLFTLNYARLIGEEATKGSISPGKLADFVVASGDFLTVPSHELENLKALATYVGGKRVYLAPEQDPGAL